MRLHDSVGSAPAGWRGVAVFLAIAYGLSWAAQIYLAQMVITAPEQMAELGGSLFIVAAALMWPPAIGAFVARRWVEDGYFGDAGLRWPPWSYLLIAWLGPAILAVLVLLISLPLYPFSLAPAAEFAAQMQLSPEAFVAIQVAQALTIAVLINSILAFGEEFGWRGYLLPRMVRLMGFWPGLLGHGAIWGFWHAPLIFLIGYNYPGNPVLGVPMFIVAGTMLGVLFGWLQLASNSVVPPTVAHAALNAIAGLPLLLLVGADPAVGGALHSPLGWLVLLAAIGVLVITGRLPSPRSDETHGDAA